MENTFELPAFFDREYYESRYNDHLARGNAVQALFWRNTYFDNAASYAWCEVYYSVLPTQGWKEAFKAADEHKKNFLKEHK